MKEGGSRNQKPDPQKKSSSYKPTKLSKSDKSDQKSKTLPKGFETREQSSGVENQELDRVLNSILSLLNKIGELNKTSTPQERTTPLRRKSKEMTISTTGGMDKELDNLLKSVVLSLDKINKLEKSKKQESKSRFTQSVQEIRKKEWDKLIKKMPSLMEKVEKLGKTNPDRDMKSKSGLSTSGQEINRLLRGVLASLKENELKKDGVPSQAPKAPPRSLKPKQTFSYENIKGLMQNGGGVLKNKAPKPAPRKLFGDRVGENKEENKKDSPKTEAPKPAPRTKYKQKLQEEKKDPLENRTPKPAPRKPKLSKTPHYEEANQFRSSWLMDKDAEKRDLQSKTLNDSSKSLDYDDNLSDFGTYIDVDAVNGGEKNNYNIPRSDDRAYNIPRSDDRAYNIPRTSDEDYAIPKSDDYGYSKKPNNKELLAADIPNDREEYLLVQSQNGRILGDDKNGVYSVPRGDEVDGPKTNESGVYFLVEPTEDFDKNALRRSSVSSVGSDDSGYRSISDVEDTYSTIEDTYSTIEDTSPTPHDVKTSHVNKSSLEGTYTTIEFANHTETFHVDKSSPEDVYNHLNRSGKGTDSGKISSELEKDIKEVGGDLMKKITMAGDELSALSGVQMEKEKKPALPPRPQGMYKKLIDKVGGVDLRGVSIAPSNGMADKQGSSDITSPYSKAAKLKNNKGKNNNKSQFYR